MSYERYQGYTGPFPHLARNEESSTSNRAAVIACRHRALPSYGRQRSESSAESSPICQS